MSTADLRLVLLLVLLVAISAVFTTCNDAPVAPDTMEVQAITKASAAGRQGLIYVGLGPRIHVLDAQTNAQVDQIEVGVGPGGLEVSPDSKTLWLGTTVYRIPQHTVKHQFGFPGGSPEFSGDGKYAYLMSGQDLLTIDAKSFQVLKRASLGISPFSGHLEVAPAGDVAYVVYGDYLQLRDPSTGTLIEEFYLPPLLNYDAGHTSILPIELKPDGSELWMPIMLGYGNGVFDTESKTFRNVPCSFYEAGLIDFLPDGSKTFIGDVDNGFCVYGSGTIGLNTGGLPISQPTYFDVSPDGTFLAFLHHDDYAPLDYPCVVKAGFTESAPAGGIDLPNCEDNQRDIVIATPGSASKGDGGGEGKGRQADLSIFKADNADPVSVGQNIVYTIDVLNNGPYDVTDIAMTDPVPEGTTLVSATVSPGSCSEKRGTVTCDIPSLPSGVGTTVTLTVRADQAGQITNTATVKPAKGVKDPDTSNNSATETTTVN